MFKINPFILGAGDAGLLPQLDDVRPRFQLPILEESESSVNRLLNSLTFQTTLPAHTRTGTSGSPKGKEKEVIPEEIAIEVDVDGLDDASFWLQAGENVPGPSKGKLFKVS